MRTGLALTLTLLVVGACSHSAAPVAPRRSAPVVQKPAPKPAWVARPVVADAAEVAPRRITVVRGDTLSGIALRTGTSVGALAVENRIDPPYLLRIGQTLRVPGGRYHKVKSGETGIAIAQAYGVRWSAVATANGLSPPYTLEIGDVLRLPTRRVVAAMTVEERAKAYTLDIDDLITGSEPAAATAAAAAPHPAAPKPVAEPTTFAGRFFWPLEGRLISRFGAKPAGRYNDGINIATPAGTPVKAAADGVVAYAGDGIAGFGGLLLLKHGDGWVTAYAHAEELLVARGDKVKRGDIIARSGATGSVDEPQLHFEIRRGRTPVDPLIYLPARGTAALN